MPSNTALGRLQASLAQVTQEFTVAAANINFDFTLVKVEAPPEYRDIATVLSPARVHEAETGSLHWTARRLGALFEGFCPKTPNLIKAYGLRASEISREVAEAEKEKRAADDNWLRMEYGGIDARSIWAAATSSKEALPVHLLACIIARMFSPAEATSIWVELIENRKRELLTDIEQGDLFHPGVLSAVQQEITREQLAKWDSSTRAWLQSADSARQKQYKQFLLIAQNINIAIHNEGQNLYSNAIHVWKTALSAMEGLILGRPHASRDAPVLLGLSAWHIFPDMIVFNGQSGGTRIQMKDSLVKEGGILSLGFSDTGPHEPLGVYWSLSLAHHTFYGNPTLRTRRLDSDGSRLTLNEFILVCMGSLLSTWRTPIQATSIVFKIIKAITDLTSAPIIEAIDNLRDSPGISTRSLSRLFKAYQDRDPQAVLATHLGRRRPNFVPVEIMRARRPFFKLTHLPSLLYLLRSSEHKISLLRRLASRVTGLNAENSIILCFSLEREKEDIVYASACAQPPEDRYGAAAKNRGPRHHRWIERPRRYAQDRDINKENIAGNIHASEEVPSFDEFCSSNLDRLQREHPHEKIEYLGGGNFKGDTRPWFHDTLTGTVTLNYTQGSYGYLIGQRDDCELSDHHPRCEHASLYCRGYGISEDSPRDYSIPELTFEDVLWCFESGLISSRRLISSLKLEPAFGFLKCLSVIYETYENLASCGATISSAIVDHPFQPQILDISGTDPWLDVDNRLRINRHSVLCLIGYFETASNIADGLKDDSRILGLSGGDSIFILSKLVNDPVTNCSDHSFTRILGNTGHPGFSIFTIPANLRAREVDPAAWRIEPTAFDNTYVDCFKSTSLHLSFTEWHAPVVQVQGIGQRESNVNLIEAVLSVRYSGKWVADVDISAALKTASLKLVLKSSCVHGNRAQEISSEMLAIETWDQVLDVPDGSVVVKATDNWLARLALVSVLCQHSKKLQGQIFVWPSRLCQDCVNASGDAIHIC
ncbi:hypothetical protein F5B22DRAFT_565905 [Xylaria bambusicola]|uniref:uncharacterized protein n=1 Tax=Xylaria bambusicola TaxID=326684 RepID=UPI00200883D3|nr:uncharacterized protein F5B22DRAFT_565905 [Xylaria bambusicola]KAI0521209.1 hypothetical protein F5B22DRAFT_565905 [Xylaria bambusicola]